MRPYDVAPRLLVDLLVAFHQKDPNWVTWEYEGFARAYVTDPDNPQSGYSMCPKRWAQAILEGMWKCSRNPSATDYTGFKALGAWAGDGPKTFVPTPEQCLALEQVEVNIPLSDYAQPYNALMVKLPRDMYSPFIGCLAYLDRNGGPSWMLSLSLFSPGNKDDIVTVVAAAEPKIEASLLRFDVECAALQDIAPKVLRVAVNSCLALANYGASQQWLFPHERASDERLGRETSERGAKARDRLKRSEVLVTFTQDIKLHRTEGVLQDCTGSPTGREVDTHWRRGHWAMQPCGVGHSERKRIFRKPVLVRADKFSGGKDGTAVVYRG